MPRKRLFPPPPNPNSGKSLQNKGPEDYTLFTVNGRITLSRRRYAAAGSDSVHPLDAWLDHAENTLSRGVREMACRLNLASRNFDKAADNLARTAQIRMCGETLRQVVESEGKAVAAAADRGGLPVNWSYADCQALDKDDEPTDKTRVYLGADGVMVPTLSDAEKQKRRAKVEAKRLETGKGSEPLPKAKEGADGPYKEFKIVTLYDDGCEHRLVSVTRDNCEEAGRLMRRDAGRVGLDKADDKVAVVDGAEWIRNQLKQQSIPLDEMGLDFYHLSEHVHRAKRVALGEEDPKDAQAPGNAWAARVLHVAKHEGFEPLRDLLVGWKKTLRGKARLQAAGALLNYITDRRPMVLYPEFLAVGRQIGSGPTESMCKATTQTSLLHLEAIEELLPASPYTDSAPRGQHPENLSWPTVRSTRASAPTVSAAPITPTEGCTTR
jgi:hypothetical protein